MPNTVTKFGHLSIHPMHMNQFNCKRYPCWFNLNTFHFNIKVRAIVTDIKGSTENTCVDNADIKMKLNEVLSEGILDSVLPYMIPQDTELTQKKFTSKPNGELSCLIIERFFK